MEVMVLDLGDPNGPLSRTVRNRLRLNGIKSLNKETARKGIPSLRPGKMSIAKNTVPVFRSGQTAEYQMIVMTNATMLIPGRDTHSTSAKAFRSFFDDPQMALAEDSEQDMIIKEMYDRAVEQLIRKLLSIHAADTHSDEEQASITTDIPATPTRVSTTLGS